MSGAKRVLVTRPEPGASATARRLESMGFQPVKLPLQETRTLPVPLEAAVGKFAAVALTSANAVVHAPGALIERLRGLPCFAVGEATAAAARASGFLQVVEGRGDGEALARSILAAHAEGPVLYLCGKVRRPDFERRLMVAGLPVTPIEAYDTVKIAYTASEISAIVGGSAVDHVLLHSANAAATLVDLVRAEDLARLFATTNYLCISGRVADGLAGGAKGRIAVAKEPSEAALLSLLEERTGQPS